MSQAAQQGILAPWAFEDAEAAAYHRVHRSAETTHQCPYCGGTATLERDCVRFGGWRCKRCRRSFLTCAWPKERKSRRLCGAVLPFDGELPRWCPGCGGILNTEGRPPSEIAATSEEQAA